MTEHNIVLQHHMKSLERQPVTLPFGHRQAAFFQEKASRFSKRSQAQSSFLNHGCALISLYRATTLLYSGLISLSLCIHGEYNTVLSEVSDTEGSVALRVSSLGLAMNCSGVQTPFGHTTYGASARPLLQSGAHGAPYMGFYI